MDLTTIVAVVLGAFIGYAGVSLIHRLITKGRNSGGPFAWGGGTAPDNDKPLDENEE